MLGGMLFSGRINFASFRYQVRSTMYIHLLADSVGIGSDGFCSDNRTQCLPGQAPYFGSLARKPTQCPLGTYSDLLFRLLTLRML